jgi:hypothetical protein
MMLTPFLALALLVSGTPEVSPATVGAPPTRILVVDFAAAPEASELARAATDATVRGLRARTDIPVEVRTLDDVQPTIGEAAVAAARDCRRGACFIELAAAADVDAVVFGELKSAEGPRPFVAELRVLSRDVERVTAKGDADAPDAAELVTAVEALALQIDLPKNEIPVVEPPKPREIFAEPLFVSGVAVVFIGGMVALASAAYAVQSEMFLGDPDIHRDLKSDALALGPASVVVAGAGLAVALLGVGVIGISFLIPATE